MSESIHDKVDAFADGELPPAEAEAFRAHLAECAECQAQLREIMMLAAVTQTHAAALAPAAGPASSGAGAAEKLAPVIPLASRRRRLLIGAVSALAAAAAVVVAWRATRPEPIVLAQAQKRSIEARLSYGAADRFRPYDVLRAAGTAREEVPLDTLARLEKRGELRGLAGGYLLSGEPERAAEVLARAPESADVESDRAAVALGRHDAAAALAHAARALALAPGHVQALWNRALALRDLGLPWTAAQAFDAVAARREAGWSDEAAARAAALRGAEAARERSRRAAAAAGREMIASGLLPAPELTRAQPGLVRRDLYEAIRAAGSAERVLGLLPVAQAIDAIDGGDRLAARVRAAAPRAAGRAAAAATYAKLAANPAAFEPAAADAYLAALGRPHDDDRWFGAALLLGRASTARAELRRIAEASRDPWLIAIADEVDGRDLPAAVGRCVAAHIDYRCAYLEYALARTQPPAEAEKTALAGLGRARAAGVDPRDLPRRFLVLLADLARARGASALADAYVDEARLMMP